MSYDLAKILSDLDLDDLNHGCSDGPFFSNEEAGSVEVHTPIDGARLATVKLGGIAEYERVIGTATEVFDRWRMLPAPQRGEIVRQMGEEMRRYKEPLSQLLTLEMGKIISEGRGEVQEAIDIADFAVGLSRQLYGMTTHSERSQHRMYEQWHPLGTVGIITAFNFPVAVWAWNAMIAAVCGDVCIWKPSLKTPLTAIATHKMMDRVLARHGFSGVFGLVTGADDTVGEAMVTDRRVPLISATGSTRMGKIVSPKVAARLGRCLLELGGNNGVIIMPDADLDLAVRAVCFGAVGTAGQRCTSTRRVFLHRDIAEAFTARLTAAYPKLRIGSPLADDTLVGPLIDGDAVKMFQDAVEEATSQGATLLAGGGVVDRDGYYVEPTLFSCPSDIGVTQHETFAPILYLLTFDTLDEAIARHNAVDQGLSSAIFTDSVRAGENFLSQRGSDCGIANVNIGTSGAEIGGAFGGEKDTGGGREAGSDSWKAYMRRQTCTINWSPDLPLAQGVTFDI